MAFGDANGDGWPDLATGGWWMPLAVSGGTALFIYLLFDYWLYIDLPRGILG